MGLGTVEKTQGTVQRSWLPGTKNTSANLMDYIYAECIPPKRNKNLARRKQVRKWAKIMWVLNNNCLQLNTAICHYVTMTMTWGNYTKTTVPIFTVNTNQKKQCCSGTLTSVLRVSVPKWTSNLRRLLSDSAHPVITPGPRPTSYQLPESSRWSCQNECIVHIVGVRKSFHPLKILLHRLIHEPCKKNHWEKRCFVQKSESGVLWCIVILFKNLDLPNWHFFCV